MSECRKCGDVVQWAMSTTGKNILLDAQAVPGGRYVIIRGEARLATTGDDRLHRERFNCHWERCKPGEP